jgi:ArsR family transcriptional regulator, arsenate/arsenite/antimonite-responsive transcriptional repressor
MARQEFKVVEERPAHGQEPDEMLREERVARFVALGQALSDPIRVRMLGLMAAAASEGRGCCGLPDLGAPVDAGEENVGVCVCEFEDYFQMGQSKVSYHVRKLKEAGMIREEKRGKWSFYSLDQEAVQELLHEIAGHLGSGVEVS